MHGRLQALQKIGKLVTGAVMSVDRAPLPLQIAASLRLFIRDENSGVLFLIDSGSDVSVLPSHFTAQLDVRVTYELFAANHSKIKTYGLKALSLKFKNLMKDYSWSFVVADVSTPIIGADLLSHFHLLPDLTRRLLIDGDTLISSSCTTKNVTHQSVHIVTNFTQFPTRVVSMLQKVPDLTKPPKYQENPPHDVVHHITTTGPPVNEKCRRLQHPLSNWVKEEFRNWTSTGVCRPSSSQWASPIVVVSKDKNNVHKSNGKKSLDLNCKKLRIVGDYTKLNQQTIPDRYPLPNLFDSTSELQGATVFSTIDLVRAYFNIPIAEEDIKKTAVISPAGLYKFCRFI